MNPLPMATDVVYVPLDHFLLFQASVSPSPALVEKAVQLRTSFGCFQEDVPRKWASKNPSHRNQVEYSKPQRIEKVKIGNRDLSRENIARKDFLALMNKLSDNNRSSILQTLKHVFREDCIDVYLQVTWDQMQRCADYHDLHVSVLKTIHGLITSPQLWREKWDALWNGFVEKQAWKPSTELLQEEDYDEFCDFVKWKKRALSSLHAWKKLERHGWVQNVNETLMPSICELCDEELFTTHGSKLTDILLDEMIVLISDGNHSPHVHRFLRKWDANCESLRPSTKFKLFDVREHVAAKMKPIAKGR